MFFIWSHISQNFFNDSCNERDIEVTRSLRLNAVIYRLSPCNEPLRQERNTCDYAIHTLPVDHNVKRHINVLNVPNALFLSTLLIYCWGVDHTCIGNTDDVLIMLLKFLFIIVTIKLLFRWWHYHTENKEMNEWKLNIYLVSHFTQWTMCENCYHWVRLYLDNLSFILISYLNSWETWLFHMVKKVPPRKV